MRNLCIFVLSAFYTFLELAEATEAYQHVHLGHPFQDVLEGESSIPEIDPMLYEFATYVSAREPWDYNTVRGPLHWDSLHTDYEDCRLQREQSPININQEISNESINCILWPENPELKFVMVNNQTEKTIKLGPYRDSNTPKSLFKQKDYRLLDIHFHTPSEHRFMDEYYPVEAHFVLNNTRTGQLMVRGIFFDVIDAWEGPESDFWTSITPFLDWVPNHLDRMTIPNVNTKNIMRIFEDACRNRRVFNYLGSLTTPGCDPGVSWHVLRHPLPMSVSTYKKMRKIIKFNARYTQNEPPLGNNLLGLACGDPGPRNLGK